MQTQTVRTGLLTYWTLTEFSDRAKLIQPWTSAGFEELIPEPRPKTAVLKDALLEVFKGQKFLVRALSGRTGFAVTLETRGNDENQYDAIVSAKFTNRDDGSEPVFTGDLAHQDAVLEVYRRFKGNVESAQLSSALVKVLGKMGGVRLRPSGGIYWLPGHMRDEWTDIANSIEGAAVSGESIGFTIHHEMDGASIKAVHAAITHEIETEAAKLTELIYSGDLGERAIKARKQDATDLKVKVKEYEEMLGVSLASLRAQLDLIDQTDAVASLLVGGTGLGLSVEENLHATVS